MTPPPPTQPTHTCPRPPELVRAQVWTLSFSVVLALEVVFTVQDVYVFENPLPFLEAFH